MFFIGLDQATKCGYAVLDDAGNRVCSGVWDLTIRPGEGAGFRYVRFVGYLRQLWSSLDLNGKNAVLAFEKSVPIAGGNSSEVGGALIGHIQYQAEVKGIPYQAIHYATVKRMAVTGRASKLEMVQAANARWGLAFVVRPTRINPKTKRQEYAFDGGCDNEADALWIADACRRGITGD